MFKVQHLGKVCKLLMISYFHHLRQLAWLLAFLKIMKNGIDAFLMLLKCKQAIYYAISLQ
jgi:hypothetical protein